MVGAASPPPRGAGSGAGDNGGGGRLRRIFGVRMGDQLSKGKPAVSLRCCGSVCRTDVRTEERMLGVGGHNPLVRTRSYCTSLARAQGEGDIFFVFFSLSKGKHENANFSHQRK